MKAWVVLLAAGVLLPLLAGCSSPAPARPPDPVTFEVKATALENRTFYAFQHRGGDLEVSVLGNGSAEVALYGADDQRLGHIGIGADQARGRFVLDGLSGGELVLHTLSINGTLDLRSGGARVDDFRPLTSHVERHLLLERETSLTGMFGVPSGSDLDETVDLELLRAPNDLLLIERAGYERLDITVTGRSGVVYEASSGGMVLPFQTGAPQPFLGAMQGEFHAENVRDGKLTVRISASSFEGLLLLESRSFSRAGATDGAAHATLDVPRFTYGALPDQPVAFEVRDGTAVLYLWQEDPPAPDERSEECDEPANAAQARCGGNGDAHVALFGPDDKRLATVAVPASGTLAIPVSEAGEWVAVLLNGKATLGADRVPGDFELRPLDVVETVAPAQAAGQNDRGFGQDRRPLEHQGVAFRLTETTIHDGTAGNAPFDPSQDLIFAGCDATTLSVLVDGETIAAWGYDDVTFAPDLAPALDPTHLVTNGELEVAYSDFGRGCERIGVAVHGYER